MKKILALSLGAALLLLLASCRGVIEKPYNVSDFIPDNAEVIEQSAGHALLEIPGSTLQQVVEFYEVALAFVASQQITLDDANADFWDYTGTYGENHFLKITIRAMEGKMLVLVTFLDELEA